jgi:hypothetical protein
VLLNICSGSGGGSSSDSAELLDDYTSVISPVDVGMLRPVHVVVICALFDFTRISILPF